MLTPQQLVRFWAKVNKTATCWYWTGCKDKDGYGQFIVGRKVLRAHRISFVLSGKTYPYGALICHKCDIPMCVNPDHLYAGNAMLNGLDCELRHRRDHTNKAKGSNHGMSKLTEEQVKEIREKRNNNIPLKTLAYQYNVSLALISLIARGKIRKQTYLK